jgi:hypothetical protein
MLGREKAGAPLSVYAVAINGDTPVVVAPVGSTPDEAALAVSRLVKLACGVSGVFL